MQNPRPTLHPDLQILINAREPVLGRGIEEIGHKWPGYSSRKEHKPVVGFIRSRIC